MHFLERLWHTFWFLLWKGRWTTTACLSVWREEGQDGHQVSDRSHSLGTWSGGWFGYQHPLQIPQLQPYSFCGTFQFKCISKKLLHLLVTLLKKKKKLSKWKSKGSKVVLIFQISIEIFFFGGTWFYQVRDVPGSTLWLTNRIWRTSL